MAATWYFLIGLMLVTYAVLDGFDFGAGIVHLFVAKTDAERREVLGAIGPVWDGNEVWLLASGGTLAFAFPKLYAVSVSGFYLPVMLLLWLLVFRALGIEMRHHFSHPLWEEAWSVAFAVSSLLIALFLGVALGNVVRGVSIDEGGGFFAPLWTNLRVGGDTGVLDWYTVLVGLLGVLVLGVHGALWLGHRTAGPVAERSVRLAQRASVGVVFLLTAVTAASVVVQPSIMQSLIARPWGALIPASALVCLGLLIVAVRRGLVERAFYASCGFIASLFGSAAFGVYPYVLPARVAARGITVSDAASSPYALAGGLVWWIPGMLLATGYFVFIYRKLPRGLRIEDLEAHDDHDSPLSADE